jgi:3-hydroxybutyryl-CoA dehydrogenase
MEIKNVLVVGSGVMGRGITQWFCQNGCRVEMVDRNPEMVKRAITRINDSWKQLVERGKFGANEVQSFAANLSAKSFLAANKKPDLVIEAVVEDKEVKTQLWREIDKIIDPAAIFASNTSSLLISTLARGVSEERKKKFIGIHFFNPAPIIDLVEVTQSFWAEPFVVQSMVVWLDSMGKKPVLCQDTPGQIVNRISRGFFVEPLHILKSLNQERIGEIDAIIKNVGGVPLGPFGLMDLIGVDTHLKVAESIWHANFFNDRYTPHPISRQMVEAGLLGKKVGKGFTK